jgi:hypothetical protein
MAPGCLNYITLPQKTIIPIVIMHLPLNNESEKFVSSLVNTNPGFDRKDLAYKKGKYIGP